MRLPNKFEVEFVILMVLILTGWVYFAIRAVLAIVGL